MRKLPTNKQLKVFAEVVRRKRAEQEKGRKEKEKSFEEKFWEGVEIGER